MAKRNKPAPQVLPDQGKNTRVLKILRGLGIEEPVMFDDADQENPEETFGLTEEEARLRKLYGGYTKPGPERQTY